MRLKDEADTATNRDEFGGWPISELVAHDDDAAVLQGTQRTDQREQCGFARTRRAGHHHDLAGEDVKMVVEEHLLPRFVGAERVVDAVDAHERRLACGAAARRTRLDDPIGQRLRHQYRSAGASASALRTATAPETTHIEVVRQSTQAPRASDISSGSPVRVAMSA